MILHGFQDQHSPAPSSLAKAQERRRRPPGDNGPQLSVRRRPQDKGKGPSNSSGWQGEGPRAIAEAPGDDGPWLTARRRPQDKGRGPGDSSEWQGEGEGIQAEALASHRPPCVQLRNLHGVRWAANEPATKAHEARWWEQRIPKMPPSHFN